LRVFQLRIPEQASLPFVIAVVHLAVYQESQALFKAHPTQTRLTQLLLQTQSHPGHAQILKLRNCCVHHHVAVLSFMFMFYVHW
jgi:hypothetical protein